MGKPAFSIGYIPPTPILVNQYFNDSTGVGDRGEPDGRGLWNDGGEWEMVVAPAIQKLTSYKAGTRSPSENGDTDGEHRSYGKPCAPFAKNRRRLKLQNCQKGKSGNNQSRRKLRTCHKLKNS